MTFWENMVAQLRRLFGRRGKVPPPLPPPLAKLLGKKYLSVIFGHLIYKPICANKTAKFIVPEANTLREFLDWADEMTDSGQVKTGHPLALEVICAIVLDYEISVKSRAFEVIKKAMEQSVTDDYPEISDGILSYMIWGVEPKEVEEGSEPDLYAEKRISRDGERFESYDVTRETKGRITGRLGG